MSRLGQHDVGHEGVITGRDAFSLRSSIMLIPKESPSLHSNQLFLHSRRFNKSHPQLLVMNQFLSCLLRKYVLLIIDRVKLGCIVPEDLTPHH